MDADQAKKLREPFPKSAIGRLPKGGVMLDYVGHAATTDRLLAVDPQWSWEPFAVDERGIPALDSKGNLWIRLTVCGVTRIGVGDGKSAKECIGDAIRNAAMRFGVALDLWAKEDLHEIAIAASTTDPVIDKAAETVAAGTRKMSRAKPVEDKTSEPISPDQVRKMAATMTSLGITNRDKALQYVADVIGRQVESRNDLTRSEASKVIDRLERDQLPLPVEEPVFQ